MLIYILSVHVEEDCNGEPGHTAHFTDGRTNSHFIDLIPIGAIKGEHFS
jgi:hypothetical protein